jgi:hypothetical protein
LAAESSGLSALKTGANLPFNCLRKKKKEKKEIILPPLSIISNNSVINQADFI